MIDMTRLGEVTAVVMDDLHADQDRGGLPEDAVIVDALVVVEVAYTNGEGDTESMVSCRVSGNRNVVAHGLVQRAFQALVAPTGEVGGE